MSRLPPIVYSTSDTFGRPKRQNVPAHPQIRTDDSGGDNAPST